ncbi:UMP-CMP kinase [Pyxicephalus adspersus]|uniref:Nucleoside-diphosphate kinase n=1 Tax=Pyxicephalus adspersus TaxID=30357 RepID=A0AAV2ZN38_PYXAD|nr:TPA: hypothetical protein GDO54_016217 [Pyxicephalus adspersus]
MVFRALGALPRLSPLFTRSLLSAVMKPIVVFVLGGPGAGKGTQCEKIVQTCIERCLERGKSSGRSDDNRESLEKRIQTYLQSTRPIINLYEQRGKVRKVDASQSVDQVFIKVEEIFDREG